MTPLILLIAPFVLALLCILLAIVHRLGGLKRLRHFQLIGAVVILTLVLAFGCYAMEQYSLNHFPLEQPGTVWETSDGAIQLSVGSSGGQEMRVLYEGEYRDASIGLSGRPYASVSISIIEDDGTSHGIIGADNWYMLGPDRLVIHGNGGRVVLRRVN